MKVFVVGLAFVLLGGAVFGLHNEVARLEQEKQEQSELAAGTIEQLEYQLNEEQYCHELANKLAIDAEYLVVDLYELNINEQMFWTIVDDWLEVADLYNGVCINESVDVLGA